MTPSGSVAPIAGSIEFIVAVVCGAIVANLYFARPVVGEIGAALGLSPQRAGLIVTLTQLGYCCGLLLLVPLGDILENRRLALSVLAVGFIAAVTMTVTKSHIVFLLAAIGLGIGSVSVQILLPYAAALADPHRQGVVVGRVMAGILTGIMLSRPVSALIAGAFGWRSVFGLAAAVCILAAFLIWKRMPPREPDNKTSYTGILRSLLSAATSNRLLQRRAAFQFLMFYSYTLFWTALPLLLFGPAYGMNHLQVSLIALAGASGAAMSPVAGTIADRGLIIPGTTIAFTAGLIAWGIVAFGASGGLIGVTVLTLGAIVLDGAVPVSLVMSQRELFSAYPEQRSRLNGLFMAMFFVGGAVGASVGVWVFESRGWVGVVVAGAAGPALALALHLISTARRPSTTIGGSTK
ncbi:MFS transporter [Agrobacterium tumefaciens]|uniref:MFS transporter n=1 Tax=Agrobacterium tumefaciens TaxID=358 RepID=UPI0015717665|nr:MFS transporter [Agrobacterium tumefaciens]NTD86781.1 MFS transporter [Agrobacterium tumefaciens]NTD91508.1 MFS transporter [Agrobacterium tumefaciens]NTD96979.1 MFS transporter [Agrobacterium tumefaciens]NTE11880.1 MFS transporter [Agrobacterium tumefaciens]NTE24778.1 MFS transporter [Agrobacterium tumefaciens]